MWLRRSRRSCHWLSRTVQLGDGDHPDKLGDVSMFGKNVFATNVVLECVLPAVHVATQSALKLDLQQVIC